MSNDRVLTSPQAKEAIRRLQTLINTDFMNQIQQLDREGTTLSDPNVWDGPLAGQFRQTWPDTKRTLERLQQELEELRQHVQQISTNIMQAGGGN